MYQWKLLNHVSREHNMTLKPAHLSYKCTVCTATFGMYKQFENHVYSAHSTVAKKSVDSSKKSSNSSSSSSVLSGRSIGGSGLTVTSSNAGDSLLKPLKINDEITIIPQPASRNNRSIEIESHVIGTYTRGSCAMRIQKSTKSLTNFHQFCYRLIHQSTTTGSTSISVSLRIDNEKKKKKKEYYRNKRTLVLHQIPIENNKNDDMKLNFKVNAMRCLQCYGPHMKSFEIYK